MVSLTGQVRIVDMEAVNDKGAPSTRGRRYTNKMISLCIISFGDIQKDINKRFQAANRI